MNKSPFFIIGQHAVIEALKNPRRKVLKVFLTEESKKNIHRKNQNQNLLKDIKVYFRTKRELDKYTTNEQIQHQGYVAAIEHLETPLLKNFILKNILFIIKQRKLDIIKFNPMKVVVFLNLKAKT